MRRVRCSPILPPRSPTGRTASTASGSAAVIGNMPSAPPRRRPRCGDWSITRIDAAHLPGIRAARAHAREVAWAAGAAPDPGEWLHLDVDATITIDHSDNKETRPRPGRRPGVITRCWCFWTAPRSPAGKHWPGCCDRAMRAATPPPTTSPSSAGRWNRCRGLPANPDDPGGPQILVRSDSAGATHAFADACRGRRGGFLLRLRRRHPGAGRGEVLNTAQTAGIRRSTPTAASATAPGSPRPPHWSI